MKKDVSWAGYPVKVLHNEMSVFTAPSDPSTTPTKPPSAKRGGPRKTPVKTLPF